MTDHLTPAARSAHMAKIGSGLKKNRLERWVHELLKGARIRHRMYPKVRPSMDVEVRTAAGPLYLAIDGCFWHACPEHYRRPKSRARFWRAHLETAEIRRAWLRARTGFAWLRIWEHWVRDSINRRDMVVGMVRAAIRKVESGRAARGQIRLTWGDVQAEWRSW